MAERRCLGAIQICHLLFTLNGLDARSFARCGLAIVKLSGQLYETLKQVELTLTLLNSSLLFTLALRKVNPK